MRQREEWVEELRKWEEERKREEEEAARRAEYEGKAKLVEGFIRAWEHGSVGRQGRICSPTAARYSGSNDQRHRRSANQLLDP